MLPFLMEFHLDAHEGPAFCSVQLCQFYLNPEMAFPWIYCGSTDSVFHHSPVHCH